MASDLQEIKDSFKSMFKLINPSKKYNPVIVASFYHIIGACLLEKPITIKKLDIDMRFSFGCCITSGFGKDAISTVVKKCADAVGMTVASFTSLHEEQLIGKRWYDKKGKKWNEVRGYFADDFLIKDDALVFLNDKNFDAARNYFLTALNIWGKNTIKKKLVEHEQGLNYDARCSFLYFIQPSEKIEIKNLSSGLFRRAPTLRIDIEEQEAKEILYKRPELDFEEKPEAFVAFLRFIRSIRIKDYKPLGPELLQQINEGVSRYYSKDPLLSPMYLANQNNVIKFCYINALLRLYEESNVPDAIELEVTTDDVIRALQDYKLIYGAIEHFVNCNMRLGSNQQHPIKTEILKLLEERGCFSEETSSLSTSDVIRETMKRTGTDTEATVSHHFYALKKEEKIVSKQVGQHSGKVWLK